MSQLEVVGVQVVHLGEDLGVLEVPQISNGHLSSALWNQLYFKWAAYCGDPITMSCFQ